MRKFTPLLILIAATSQGQLWSVTELPDGRAVAANSLEAHLLSKVDGKWKPAEASAPQKVWSDFPTGTLSQIEVLADGKRVALSSSSPNLQVSLTPTDAGWEFEEGGKTKLLTYLVGLGVPGDLNGFKKALKGVADADAATSLGNWAKTGGEVFLPTKSGALWVVAKRSEEPTAPPKETANPSPSADLTPIALGAGVLGIAGFGFWAWRRRGVPPAQARPITPPPSGGSVSPSPRLSEVESLLVARFRDFYPNGSRRDVDDFFESRRQLEDLKARLELVPDLSAAQAEIERLQSDFVKANETAQQALARVGVLEADVTRAQSAQAEAVSEFKKLQEAFARKSADAEEARSRLKRAEDEVRDAVDGIYNGFSREPAPPSKDAATALERLRTLAAETSNKRRRKKTGMVAADRISDAIGGLLHSLSSQDEPGRASALGEILHANLSQYVRGVTANDEGLVAAAVLNLRAISDALADEKFTYAREGIRVFTESLKPLPELTEPPIVGQPHPYAASLGATLTQLRTRGVRLTNLRTYYAAGPKGIHRLTF